MSSRFQAKMLYKRIEKKVAICLVESVVISTLYHMVVNDRLNDKWINVQTMTREGVDGGKEGYQCVNEQTNKW